MAKKKVIKKKKVISKKGKIVKKKTLVRKIKSVKSKKNLKRKTNRSLTPLTFDSISTDKGCLQHLLAVEHLSPGHRDYDFDDAKICLRAMKSCITNRKAYGNAGTFCSRTAVTWIDFICAPIVPQGSCGKQFKHFIRNVSSTGKITVSIPEEVMQIITDGLAIANGPVSPRQKKYFDFYTEIKFVSSNVIVDPFSVIPARLGTVDVKQGTYGWRTAGSGAPGGSYVDIPSVYTPQGPSGQIQKIQFYTIKV